MTKYSGRTLSVSIGAGDAGQLRSFGAFGSTRALTDASVYNEDWTDFVAGLQDGTETDAVFARDPADAGQNDVIDAYTTGSDTPITITVTHDGSGESFDITCFVTTLTYESPIDGLYTLNTTLKIVNPGVVPGS